MDEQLCSTYLRYGGQLLGTYLEGAVKMEEILWRKTAVTNVKSQRQI